MVDPTHETSARPARTDDAKREARLFIDALRALRRAARLVREQSDADVARAISEDPLARGLRVLPFRGSKDVVVRDVARAVTWLGRFFGPRRCLIEALAARELLALRGIESTVCYGVSRTGTRSTGVAIAAHAWLEHEGAIVIGGGPHAHTQLLSSSSAREDAQGGADRGADT